MVRMASEINMKNKMPKAKILIINTVDFQLNGISSVIMNYYVNMNKSGLKIDFVAISEVNEKYKREIIGNNSRIYILPRKKNSIKYQFQLMQLLIKNDYDIVHIHGNSATMLVDVIPCKLARINNIIVHSHNTTCNHVIIHQILKPFFSKTYSLGLACGEESGKWLYGNRQFQILKNGIEINKYKYNVATRKEYRDKIAAGEKIVIGHVGNFVEQKNHFFLLDVFFEILKQNQNYILMLIGDGPLIDQIKSKAQSLNMQDSIIFIGKTLEVEKYLQAMDLFVLPSLFEGLPVSLIEALASGLPCVVSNQITKEVDLAGTFHYIDIGNPTLWKNEILQLNIDETLREQNSLNWCKIIIEKKYDIKSNTEMLRKIYINLAEQKSKSKR